MKSEEKLLKNLGPIEIEEDLKVFVFSSGGHEGIFYVKLELNDTLDIFLRYEDLSLSKEEFNITRLEVISEKEPMLAVSFLEAIKANITQILIDTIGPIRMIFIRSSIEDAILPQESKIIIPANFQNFTSSENIEDNFPDSNFYSIKVPINKTWEEKIKEIL